MADIQFRIFGGNRPRPDSRPSPLQQFLRQVERETNGPTDELVQLYREFQAVRERRSA